MAASEEEALAQIDGAVVQARERAVHARAYATELETLRATGHSSDGAAEVTIGHTGVLTASTSDVGWRMPPLTASRLRSWRPMPPPRRPWATGLRS
ncbi:MAG: hypothetical protein JWO76_1265 [Nocardioides sp.]|nr:hypothetical protein [Nocardioides sp.]